MPKQKKLSDLTVEEFEDILSKYVNELIIGIGNYKSTININSTPSMPVMPWDDQYKVWCGTDSVWYDGKNGNL